MEVFCQTVRMFETIFFRHISESEVNIDIFPPSHLPPTRPSDNDITNTENKHVKF